MKPEHFPGCLRDTPISVNLDTLMLPRDERDRRGSQVGDALVIPVVGIVTHRPQPMFAANVSTVEIAHEIRRAEASPRIKRIILDMDSPGGAIGGVPELADIIHGTTKPTVAVINAEASGTAYWIASQAREVVVSPSGAVGGVGVAASHDDFSAALKKSGIRRTLIAAGARKVDANPWQPLSVRAEHDLQKRVEELHDLFVSQVARGRGVSEETVRESFGQGRVVSASHAVDAGMADAVGTLDEVLSNPQAGRRAMRAQRFRRAFA